MFGIRRLIQSGRTIPMSSICCIHRHVTPMIRERKIIQAYGSLHSYALNVSDAINQRPHQMLLTLWKPLSMESCLSVNSMECLWKMEPRLQAYGSDINFPLHNKLYMWKAFWYHMCSAGKAYHNFINILPRLMRQDLSEIGFNVIHGNGSLGNLNARYTDSIVTWIYFAVIILKNSYVPG